MIIHDVKQNSTEWLALRRGRVTASEIDSLVSPTGKVRTGDGPSKFLYRKVAEKLLGWAPDDAFSRDMANGSLIELEAVPWVAFSLGLDCKRVGFCSHDTLPIGFSPDAIIGDEGGLEVKAPTAPVHCQYLDEGVVPDSYVGQVQMSLYVSQRKWWRFCSYHRQLPALMLIVEPDPKFQKAIGEAFDAFVPKFNALLAKLARMKAEHENPLKEAYEAKIREWELTGKIP